MKSGMVLVNQMLKIILELDNYRDARIVHNLKAPASVMRKTLDLSMEEGQFRRTIQISEVKPTDWQYTYKVVTVVVRWQEPNGLNRRIKIAGLVAKL